MKKSPLSTPSSEQTYYRERNNQGYENSSNCYNRYCGPNNSFGSEGNMIPLSSSSPIKMPQKNNWRYQNNKHHLYNHKASGSYNAKKNFSLDFINSQNFSQRSQKHQAQNYQVRNKVLLVILFVDKTYVIQ